MEKIKEILANVNPKLKNPYFLIGILGLIFASSGVDFNTLTSWSLLGQSLLGIVSNPVSVVGIITSVLAMWNNNDTKGLDKNKLYDTNEFRDI